MKVRRVVTGHSGDGKAIVASDTEVEGTRVDLMPGIELHRLWGSDSPPAYPDDGSPMESHTYFPPVGGFRFIQFVAPPASSAAPPDVDEEAGIAEMEEKLPGLLSTLEADTPGMHTSDTVDLLYIVSGEITLELDDGMEVELLAGDTIVQSGTRHRWHNRSAKPCRIIAVCIGARRTD